MNREDKEFADLYYDVWLSGGNPDLVDRDRFDDDYDGQYDFVYDSDILKTAQIIEDLPPDRRQGQKYYLTTIPASATLPSTTQVDSKTPGGNRPCRSCWNA